MEPDPEQNSSLLKYLPAVFQADRTRDTRPGRRGWRPTFLGRFLLAFERVLLGLPDPKDPDHPDLDGPGLEETISRLYRYFDPDGEPRPGGVSGQLPEHKRAPKEFLSWLAGWLAITFSEDWDEQQQRNLIANAVRLYQIRGTKRGVAEFVQIYTQNQNVQIDEFTTAFQLGKHSVIGVDTLLGGGAPFFFQVHVQIPANPTEVEELRRQREVAQAIIDLQKPAHTYYSLSVDAPKFIIGETSTVGQDTLLTS
jgi:phage tail-like protein